MIDHLLLEKATVTALKAAQAASAEILSRRRSSDFSVSQKAPRDYVTSADLAVERIITEIIKHDFPQDVILGEEGDISTCLEAFAREPGVGVEPEHYPASGPNLWIVDPIDGTTNFMRGLSHVAVSIAFSAAGMTQLGVVQAPFLGETFMARRGEGATLNGSRIHCAEWPKNNSETLPDLKGIHALERAVVATGLPYDRRNSTEIIHRLSAIVQHCQDLRRNGSAALDLCNVACGRFDCFFEQGLKPWDVAAGALIVREAGGSVTNIGHPPDDYDKVFGSLPDELLGHDILACPPAIFHLFRELLTHPLIRLVPSLV